MDEQNSFGDFRKWIAKNENLVDFFNVDGKKKEQDLSERYIGMEVKTKVSRKKLLERIETDGDPDSSVEDFIENGGVIYNVDGKMFHIETDISTFSLPRFCVKIRKQAE